MIVKMYQNNFPEDLIKGRIVETIFEQMFREGTDYDIYPLGYEHTIPILSQVRDNLKHGDHKETLAKIIDNFNDTPDFLLIKPDKSKVFVVEVKYRAKKEDAYIRKIAQEINRKWDPAWLFVATKEGFFFDAANDIIHHKPQISLLSTNWISADLQQKYLKLVQEFEI